MFVAYFGCPCLRCPLPTLFLCLCLSLLPLPLPLPSYRSRPLFLSLCIVSVRGLGAVANQLLDSFLTAAIPYYNLLKGCIFVYSFHPYTRVSPEPSTGK